MSLSRPRFLATSVVLCALFALATPASAASTSANTWVSMGGLPGQLSSPVFAIAVSPGDSRLVLLGTGDGNIYRSADSGASWSPVANSLGRGILAIAFNPFDSAKVFAGTRADGIWISSDGGKTWTAQPGTASSSVRVFGFTKTSVVAGTDTGLLMSSGKGWSAAGLVDVSVDALAVNAVNEPVKIVAGGDTAGQDGLPLYESTDDAKTWKPLRNPAAASVLVAALAAGSLMKNKDIRPILMGTNSGGFISVDNGQSWSALGLPPTDITQAAFVVGHADRFYLASDGGGSDHGGLWYSGDAGATFRDLKPPLPEVTALAVSGGDQPMLYAATFRPIDHAVMLWSYHDTGGVPRAPAGGVPPPARQSVQAPAADTSAPPASISFMPSAVEFPYVVSGALAMFVLFLALIAYLVRGRPKRA